MTWAEYEDMRNTYKILVGKAVAVFSRRAQLHEVT
jgi:hypothetical protein